MIMELTTGANLPEAQVLQRMSYCVSKQAIPIMNSGLHNVGFISNPNSPQSTPRSSDILSMVVVLVSSGVGLAKARAFLDGRVNGF